MTSIDILRQRLHNQQLIEHKFKTPAEVVSWFGAMQAQDYPGARWAIGQRLPGATDKSLEAAFDKGEILRTHVMRPTWHFVHPSDMRWLLALTASRVKAVMSYYNRQLGLNHEIFKKSQEIFNKVLKGRNFKTRDELSEYLEKEKLPFKGQALGHIVMWAELDGVIVSGPRKGKQFTYALLEERAPKTKSLNRDESLATLTKRYFQSHGPATIKDFAWWSGLTVGDVKHGIEICKPKLESEAANGITHYFYKSQPPEIPDDAYLLPNYDEYGIAYKERSAFYTAQNINPLISRDNVPFNHMTIYKGKLIGMWKRTLKKDSIIIEAKFFTKPTSEEYGAFKKAATQYGNFLNLRVTLT